VVFAQFGKGLCPRILEKQILPCPDGQSGPKRWAVAVEALADGVNRWSKREADTTLILSNHFAQFELVPWDDQLLNDKEKLAYARHCFEKVYGDAAAAWTLHLSHDKAGSPMVASAVDASLLDAVARTFDGSRLRLRSIQPYLMSAFNQWRHCFKGKTAWFVLVERGKLCMALFHQEQWRRLRSMNIGETWQEELPLLLERENYLEDMPASRGDAFIFAPDQADTRLPAKSNWHFHRLNMAPLPGFAPYADGQFAIVMRD
jgi:hypothetical protein